MRVLTGNGDDILSKVVLHLGRIINLLERRWPVIQVLEMKEVTKNKLGPVKRIFIPGNKLSSAAFLDIEGYLQGLRMDEIIRIHEYHPLATTMLQTGIAGIRKAAVLLVDNYKTRIFPCILPQNIKAGVWASVIDAYGLPIRKSLGKHGIQAPSQVPFHFIYRNNE